MKKPRRLFRWILVILAVLGAYPTIRMMIVPRIKAIFEIRAPEIDTVKEKVTEYINDLEQTKNLELKRLFERGLTLYQGKEHLQAIDTLQSCLRLQPTPNEEIAVLVLIGNAYKALDKLVEAEGYYEKSLSLAKEIDNREEGEAAVLANLSLIYKANRDFDKALSHLKKALNIHKNRRMRKYEARDLGNIALIYQDKNHLEKALKYHHEALKIYQEEDSKEDQADQLSSIGLIYKRKNWPDSALYYSQKALKIYQEIGPKEHEASQLSVVGQIFRDKRDPDSALSYHYRSLKKYQQIDSRGNVAAQLSCIGLIHRANGNLDSATIYLEEAIDKFEKMNMLPEAEKTKKHIKSVVRQKRQMKDE